MYQYSLKHLFSYWGCMTDTLFLTCWSNNKFTAPSNPLILRPAIWQNEEQLLQILGVWLHTCWDIGLLQSSLWLDSQRKTNPGCLTQGHWTVFAFYLATVWRKAVFYNRFSQSILSLWHYVCVFQWTTWSTLKKANLLPAGQGSWCVVGIWQWYASWHLLAYQQPLRNHHANRPIT